jgi:hypothetical protein
MVKSCKACQVHAKQIHTPAQALQMIPPFWPFVVWGWIPWDHSPGPSAGFSSSSSPSTKTQSGWKPPGSRASVRTVGGPDYTQAEPPGRPHSSWSMGLKPAFPRQSLWTPHGSSHLMSLCRNSYGVRTWTLSTSAVSERQPKMHGKTQRSGATSNGSCIVGSSGSGT